MFIKIRFTIHIWLRNSSSALWHAHVHVANQSHDRRPRTSITDENIRAIRELLKEDRRLTVDEIASSEDLRQWSVHSLIRFLCLIVTYDGAWIYLPIFALLSSVSPLKEALGGKKFSLNEKAELFVRL